MARASSAPSRASRRTSRSSPLSAVAVRGQESFAVLDWKSDVAPDRQDRSDHIAQLSDYVAAMGVLRGAVVYMSLGEVVWVSSAAS